MGPIESYPQPTYEFSIPSIHDDIALACRVYCANGKAPDSYTVPETKRSPRVPRARGAISPPPSPQTAKGAVIAHNYPYFGGSYDNAIVLRSVKKLLEEGFIVGTFNYR